MMGDGYAVDYDALADMGASLEALRDEFEGISGDPEGDAAAVGHERVVEALGVFGTNWSDERRRIISAMGEVARYSEGAAGTYEATDSGLSDELDAQ